MKKLDLFHSAVSKVAALFAAVLCIAGVASCSDPYDDSDLRGQISSLNDRISTLEEEMDAQLAALRAIINGKTTVLSCIYDEETGYYTITLSDEKAPVITVPGADAMPQEITAPMVSYVEVDGVKYWATVSEDGTAVALTDASGNKIPVESEKTPELKLENGTWMISADGLSWTPLIPSVESSCIFSSVEETETSVIFTLADGSVIEIEKFQASEETSESFYATEAKQVFTAGEVKYVNFVMEGITKIAVLEKPEGWSASTPNNQLKITAPAEDNTDAETSGVIKVLGVTADGGSYITEVYVSVGVAEFTMTVSNGLLSITPAAELVDAYIYYGIMPADEYSADAVAAGLEDYSVSYSMVDQWNAPLVEQPLTELLGSELQEGTRYIIWALYRSAYDWGAYDPADIYTVTYAPVSVKFSVLETGFDAMTIKVEVMGADSYIQGYAMKDNLDLATVLSDYVSWGSDFVSTEMTYVGELGKYGDWGSVLYPDTEYVIYALPLISGKAASEYTVDDFRVSEPVRTASFQPGGTVNVEFTDLNVTLSSATVKISQSGAYKVYGQYMSADVYAMYADDAALVQALTSNYNLFDMSLSAYSLTPGAKGYFVAVAVDKDGKYGQVAKIEANTKELVWSDATLTLGTPEVSTTSVSIPYTLTGTTATSVKYLNATNYEIMNNSWAGWTDQLSDMELILATSDFGTTLTGEDMASPIELSYLSTGTEYHFFMIAYDADGNPVHGITYTYTPGLPGDMIIRAGAEGYDLGKPVLTVKNAEVFEDSDFMTLTFDITVDENCKEYYIHVWDSEYGNDWTSKFYATLNQGYRYEGNQTDVMLEWVVSSNEIAVVWVDVNGKYHETFSTPASDYITAAGTAGE